MSDDLRWQHARLSRRGLLKGFAVSAGAVVLAACGGGGGGGTTGGGGGGAGTTPTTGGAAVGGGGAAGSPAAQGGGAATTITWFASRDTTGYRPKLVEHFNKANRIQLDYQEQGATTTDLHDKFVTVASAQDPTADIVSLDVPFVPEFAAAGWTIPVDDALPQDEKAKFFQGTIHGATYEGNLWDIPWFNNGPGLYYRKVLLDSNGLKLPKTYD